MMNGRRKTARCVPTVYYKAVKVERGVTARPRHEGYLDGKKRATTSGWFLAISQVFPCTSDRVRPPSRHGLIYGLRDTCKHESGRTDGTNCASSVLCRGRRALEIGKSQPNLQQLSRGNPWDVKRAIILTRGTEIRFEDAMIHDLTARRCIRKHFARGRTLKISVLSR